MKLKFVLMAMSSVYLSGYALSIKCNRLNYLLLRKSLELKCKQNYVNKYVFARLILSKYYCMFLLIC